MSHFMQHNCTDSLCLCPSPYNPCLSKIQCVSLNQRAVKQQEVVLATDTRMKKEPLSLCHIEITMLPLLGT